MNLSEQIKEGQHAANQIISSVKEVFEKLTGEKIALRTFEEEFNHQYREFIKEQTVTGNL